MARSFFLCKLWQDLLTRVGTLEAQQGTIPPPEDYNTVADIRAETVHTAGGRIFCLENHIIYIFDAASTAVDNGATILKPDNITVGNPGRWLKEMELANKAHTHSEYTTKIVTPAQTKFLLSDATGQPVEGATGPADYAAAGHTHSGYATEEDLLALQTIVGEALDEIDTKVDKYAVQAGDIGKPAVFDSNGNVIPGNTIIFYEFTSGALVAGVTKSVAHNKDLAVGYIINMRSADNETNAGGIPVLKPTPAEPHNSVDIQSAIDIAAPGLIIQILGA